LRFLLSHLDKRSDTFYYLCKELASNLQPINNRGFIDELLLSLNHGLISKAKYLISKNYRESTNSLDIFGKLIERGEFSHYQMRKLAKTLNLPEELKSRLKSLRGFEGDSTLIINLISSQESYNQYMK
jgi:hypothetical protein